MKATRLNTQRENNYLGFLVSSSEEVVFTWMQHLYNWICAQFSRLQRISPPGFIVKLMSTRLIKIHLVEECY